MSRYDPATERDVYRACIVDAFGDVDLLTYLRIRSRADATTETTDA